MSSQGRMRTTEFRRVPEERGYYISSNAPSGGVFVPMDEVRGMIEKAHMAGQWNNGAGVDPSCTEAQRYADGVFGDKDGGNRK